MSQPQKGKFITFEGGEGSGKSTQIRLLRAAFKAAGHEALQTREPGGTDGAEMIRELLVTGESGRWDPISETLLFYASRREHLVRLIEPALAKGTHVISDRFADSSRVYQGYGKELGDDYVMQIQRLTMGDFAPDLTLWFDLDPADGVMRALSRSVSREENRFENTAGGFHERVREGFNTLAEQEPQRILRIDAGQSIEEVHSAIIDTVNQRLGLSLKPQKVDA